jgi:hypothetical protein
MIPVAVFAHNEARGILRCLRSFAAGAPGALRKIRQRAAFPRADRQSAF